MDSTMVTLLLGRLGRLHETLLTDACAEFDSTPAEMRVLALLARAKGGVASPRDLAAFVVQTSGGLTATLGRLERSGQIRREADPSDGRGRLVVLTDEGRALQAGVIDRATQLTTAALGSLDLDAVGETVLALVTALEAASGRPNSVNFNANQPVAA